MFQVEKINTNSVPLYVIEEIPKNWNDFTNWLYHLEDGDMSLCFHGNMYRFRTVEERIQFIFGFTKAWEMIDETYIKHSNGEMQWL